MIEALEQSIANHPSIIIAIVMAVVVLVLILFIIAIAGPPPVRKAAIGFLQMIFNGCSCQKVMADADRLESGADTGKTDATSDTKETKI